MAERLQKILSAAGVASRRTAETLIVQGRVTVNGTTVTELGTGPMRAATTSRGRPRSRARSPRYILLYKPRATSPHALIRSGARR